MSLRAIHERRRRDSFVKMLEYYWLEADVDGASVGGGLLTPFLEIGTQINLLFFACSSFVISELHRWVVAQNR